MMIMMLLPKSGWLLEGGVRAVSPDHHNKDPSLVSLSPLKIQIHVLPVTGRILRRGLP